MPIYCYKIFNSYTFFYTMVQNITIQTRNHYILIISHFYNLNQMLHANKARDTLEQELNPDWLRSKKNSFLYQLRIYHFVGVFYNI